MKERVVGNFICGSTNEYTFCAQTGEGCFYLAITDPDIPPAEDLKKIRSWFGNRSQLAFPVPTPPAGTTIPNGARIYDVTNFIPNFVVKKNGTKDEFVGPNCYQAALVAAGFSNFEGRYVDGHEFEYYLKRNFESAPCEEDTFGSLVVYDRSPTTYNRGEHAAFALPASVIFHKGGLLTYYPYEIVAMNAAIQAVDSHWRPSSEDRFDKRQKPSSEGYKYLCYKERPVPENNAASGAKKVDSEWFMPLFSYYKERLEKALKLKCGEYQKKRIDLLTLENLSKTLRDFSDRIGNYDPVGALLSIDEPIAQKYLRLESLYYQYYGTIESCAPLRETRSDKQWEELYEKHYVNFDKDFEDEIDKYLELKGVALELWPKIQERVKEKICEYDLKALSKRRGKIPYFDILDMEIGRALTTK